MIVWARPYDLNASGRYNPSTDSWTSVSAVNMSSYREGYTAVWTGNEMIIWGGKKNDFGNTGGRYNPRTDTWRPTSTTNAPTGPEKASHRCVDWQ